MNKLVGGNDAEGIAPERPSILGGLAARLQEGFRATIVALGQSDAQRLAAIVESSADAILSVDLDGIIATWNRGAEKLLGYTGDEVIGKPVTMLIPANRQGEEPAILERIGRGERIQEFETERLRKDGSPVAVSLSVSPIMDAGGTIIGASKIGRDITERKRADVYRHAEHCFRVPRPCRSEPTTHSPAQCGGRAIFDRTPTVHSRPATSKIAGDIDITATSAFGDAFLAGGKDQQLDDIPAFNVALNDDPLHSPPPMLSHASARLRAIMSQAALICFNRSSWIWRSVVPVA